MLVALRKQKLLLYILLSALILALSLEFLAFMTKTEILYEKESVSVLEEDTLISVHNYAVSGNSYSPSGADPQLILQNVNAPAKTLILVFAEPTQKKASLEIFYTRAPGATFTQENAVSKLSVPRGTTELPIALPDGEYHDFRIDIDGSFTLSDIRVSTGAFEKDTNFFAISFSLARLLILFVFFSAIALFFPYVLLKDRGPRGLKKHEFLFLAILFFFYMFWAFEKSLNYAPDESMRYDVTRFLFDNGRLPVGDELLSDWGFSYAHLPAVLCNQLGFVLMKIAAPFTSSAHSLLLAARMVSVISATFAIYFVIKCCKLLFHRSEVRWMVTFLIAFMPQYAFLSSYVNNDIVAFLGITMIAYAWLLGWKCGWRFSTALLLAGGISICALSYYNSYAWILLSVAFCVYSYLSANPKDTKGLLKLCGFVAGVVVLLVGYSFIRHLVVYGDLLGFRTSHEYGELYAIDSLKPSTRLSLAEMGVSLSDMLFLPHKWLLTTGKSFIALFGYMQYSASRGVYFLIGAFFALGLLGALIKFGLSLYKKEKHTRVTWAFYLALLACAVITVALSIRNSYVTDFQPQGRYCYPAFLSIAIFCGHGYDIFTSRFPKEYRYVIAAVFCTLLVSVNLYTVGTVYLPS